MTLKISSTFRQKDRRLSTKRLSTFSQYRPLSDKIVYFTFWRSFTLLVPRVYRQKFLVNFYFTDFKQTCEVSGKCPVDFEYWTLYKTKVCRQNSFINYRKPIIPGSPTITRNWNSPARENLMNLEFALCWLNFGIQPKYMGIQPKFHGIRPRYLGNQSRFHGIHEWVIHESCFFIIWFLSFIINSFTLLLIHESYTYTIHAGLYIFRY